MPLTTLTVKDGMLISVKKQKPAEYLTFIGVSLVAGVLPLIASRKLTGNARRWAIATGVLRIGGTLLGAGVVLGKFITVGEWAQKIENANRERDDYRQQRDEAREQRDMAEAIAKERGVRL